MEWDKKRNQLFSAKIATLEKLKQEYADLQGQLNGLPD